mmetsp:Transcript_76652/g.236806  ORF Transcript_76652/g.236806 Transcript_76652/m.236806 type:complete len:232 (+) Transcript_76652:541-1236(+)
MPADPRHRGGAASGGAPGRRVGHFRASPPHQCRWAGRLARRQQRRGRRLHPWAPAPAPGLLRGRGRGPAGPRGRLGPGRGRRRRRLLRDAGGPRRLPRGGAALGGAAGRRGVGRREAHARRGSPGAMVGPAARLRPLGRPPVGGARGREAGGRAAPALGGAGGAAVGRGALLRGGAPAPGSRRGGRRSPVPRPLCPLRLPDPHRPGSRGPPGPGRARLEQDCLGQLHPHGN